MPTATSADDHLLRLLADSEMEVEGRLLDASNLALRVWVNDGESRIPAVYKPIQGERPLWDFPDGSLAGREWASWYISDLTGWGFVPPTVLRDGPLGEGTVQLWVGPLDGRHDPELVRIDSPAEVPDGNLAVLSAEDDRGRPLVVSHTDSARLRSLATFDAVLNNADRKASALLADHDGFWAIDHGLCLHHEAKLRTVFWGFAGAPIADDDHHVLRELSRRIGDDDVEAALTAVLDDEEIGALQARVDELLAQGTMPDVPYDRHPLPWPLW